MNIIIYSCHLWFDLPNNNIHPGWHTGNITRGSAARSYHYSKAFCSGTESKQTPAGLRSLHD